MLSNHQFCHGKFTAIPNLTVIEELLQTACSQFAMQISDWHRLSRGWVGLGCRVQYNETPVPDSGRVAMDPPELCLENSSLNLTSHCSGSS